jgi:hypothetical protein
MRRLSKAEQEEAMTAAALLYTERRNGTRSEQEIADSLKFESVEHMYHRLDKDWGFPEWLVYPKPPKPPRQARSNGDRGDLLPSRDKSQELFRPLVAALQYGVEQLDLRKEYRQGGRFVSVDVQTGSVLDTRELTREALKKGLKKLPKDTYEWRDATAEFPGGAAPWPPEPLTTLIALYALAGESLKPLVEVLHPNSPRADWNRIEKYVSGKDGLRRRARQLATAVCGWKLGQGRHPEEIDRERHNAALYVSRRTREGASYEDILHELQAAPGFLKELKKRRSITLEDVESLGALRLRPPER